MIPSFYSIRSTYSPLALFFPSSLTSVANLRVFLRRVRHSLKWIPSLTIFVNRRDRQAFLRSRKTPDERLRKLDDVAPTRTLEVWFTSTKDKMKLSDAVDSQFVW